MQNEPEARILKPCGVGIPLDKKLPGRLYNFTSNVNEHPHRLHEEHPTEETERDT